MYYILCMLEKTLRLLLTSILLSACSGYQFVENDNPLAIHGIRSLSIPMFINKSPLPEVGALVTKEITLLLSSYPGLKINSGESLGSDAILVGVIGGQQSLSELVQTTERKFTSGDLKTSLGTRKEFYVPTGSSLVLDVQFILIKNPRREDLELMKSELAPVIVAHPRVVLNQSLNLNASFTRVVGATTDIDSPGLVNLTKNKAILDRALEEGSKSLASQFKDVVLNAF